MAFWRKKDKPVPIGPPSDDDLPEIRPMTAWEVSLVGGDVLTVHAHQKIESGDWLIFNQITSYQWKDYSWLLDQRYWRARARYREVARFSSKTTKAVKLVVQDVPAPGPSEDPDPMPVL